MVKRKQAEASSSSSTEPPKAPSKPASLYQNWKQHARKNHTELKQLKGKEFTTAAKATFSALAPSDPSHVLAAQKRKDDTVIYTNKLKEYTTALNVWEAQEHATANAREVKRIRGMSETELLSFVQEVNGLRTSLANINAAKVAAEEKEERRLVEEATMLERRIQEKAKNVPKDAKKFKKSIRQDLKKQLKYSPAMKGGRPGTLSCSQYNVSQDVWDCMFPEAKGRSSVNITDPSDTFDASYSYFTKAMRYGGSLVVTSMSASLSNGQLRVNGKSGISKY